MKKSTSRILGLSLLLGSILFATSAFASTIPPTPSIFETYLASTLGTNDTSMTIATSVLRDGNSLTGFNCFTIDANTPSLEYVCGTVSGTSVTGLVRGLDAVSGTTTVASLQYNHHRGADVKVTDYPALAILQRIFSGIDSLSNVFSYSSSVATSTIAQNRSNIADWGLVQDTAFNSAGVINATTGARGVVQLATGAQAAASTATGSSGAALDLPSSLATSTRNSLTAANRIVVTNGSGYIDNTFVDPTAAFAIAANSGNKITANGVAYAFPTVQGATSTALVNNGSGTLAWGGYSNQLAASSTIITSAGTASSTIYTTTVPGNTLGNNNAIRIDLPLINVNGAGSTGTFVEVAYGNATSTIDYTASTGGVGELTVLLMGSGATNSQRLATVFHASSQAVPSVQQYASNLGGMTAFTVDSTASQVLQIVIRQTGTPGAITTSGISTTEVLRQ